MLLPHMDRLEMVVSVQGNIGAGKTTLLNTLRSKLNRDANVVFVSEPVDEWRTKRFRDGNMSMLDLFYQDMKKNAFLFQVNAFNTRQAAFIAAMKAFVARKSETKAVLISERSMISDKLFCGNLFPDVISEEEWYVYNQFFDTVTSELVKLEKVMIYLDVDYRTCHARLKKRARGEEVTVSEDYLLSLQEAHDKMLIEFAAIKGNRVIRVKWEDMEEYGEEMIRTSDLVIEQINPAYVKCDCS